MLEPGQESNGGNGRLLHRGYFERKLEEADGDAAKAIASIEDKFGALAFVLGYRDRLAEEGVDSSEAHKHAVVRIYQHFGDISCGNTAVLTEKHALWQPIFEIVKLKEEMGSGWERAKEAVHLFDQADDYIIPCGLELS